MVIYLPRKLKCFYKGEIVRNLSLGNSRNISEKIEMFLQRRNC